MFATQLAPRGAEVVAELGDRFTRAGFRLYLVGGAVRDLCAGRSVSDLDLTTDARPDQFEELLASFGTVWDAGRLFGTLAVVFGDGPDDRVEVTTFRREGYNPDSRKPVISYGESLEEDLSRRDFTINAMAIEVATGELNDPFGGREDLDRGLLRTPRDPHETISDDPLRAVRAVRFAAVRGWEIDGELRDAIREGASRLEIVSGERIAAELEKILRVGGGALRRAGLQARACGVSEAIFGPFAAGAEDLSVPRIEGVVGGLVELALVSGMESSRVREALIGMKFSGAVARAVEARLRIRETGAVIEDLGAARQITRTWSTDREALGDGVRLIDEPRATALFEAVLAEDDIFDPLPVDGYDLMEVGLEGRGVGEALRRIEKMRCDDPRLSREEALAVARGLLGDE